jgi:hypothetical protein
MLTQVLATHNILSAPVVSRSKDEGAAEPVTDILGFFDVQDILSSFLQGQYCVHVDE